MNKKKSSFFVQYRYFPDGGNRDCDDYNKSFADKKLVYNKEGKVRWRRVRLYYADGGSCFVTMN